MEIFPKTLGTRPRLAVELKAEGVVAARADDAAALLTAAAESPLPEGVLSLGLRPGNFLDRDRVVFALRAALDAIADRTGERNRSVTFVVPDATMRVLLLEFDSLPAKPVEALAVVRFRLKKLLPFDSEQAALSYQIMSSEKDSVRVLAVAMPQEVLEEYEQAITDAGYQPGAVLPSTLAALAGLEERPEAALVVNAGAGGVTTAIVRSGVLLLHRSIEFTQDTAAMEEQDQVSQALAADEAAMTGREIAQAVSVATAYFEDTLSSSPEEILSAGTLGAESLPVLLLENGLDVPTVREMVGPEALAAGAATARVSRNWLASVRGALRN